METSGLGALEVRGIEKKVGDFTLTANFSLRPGERAVLIGRSGSGKTTLLRILAGLGTPTAGKGRILLGQRDITDLPTQKGRLALFSKTRLFSLP